MITLHHIIRPHESGLRLDVFAHRLISALPETSDTSLQAPSRTLVRRFITAGDILINTHPAKPTLLLKTGDTLSGHITLSPTYPQLIPNHTLSLPIVFENEHFLIIDKPARLLTHPTHLGEIESVAQWFAAHYPETPTSSEYPLRPGIIHRLDRDTSGLMILAKTSEALQEFKHLFATRQVSKTYLALVHGHLTPLTGTIDLPLARSATQGRHIAVTSGRPSQGRIRSARTTYAVREHFSDADLVELHPQTGRTHQIRVHLSHLGHPLLGDHLYGTKATRATDRAQGYTHHLLHAHQLSFTLFGQKYTFTSPLPPEFQKI